MNTKGKVSGIFLILLLVVAILVAYLAVTQMGGLGFGKQETQQETTQQNLVDAARDAVDAINEKINQTGAEP